MMRHDEFKPRHSIASRLATELCKKMLPIHVPISLTSPMFVGVAGVAMTPKHDRSLGPPLDLKRRNRKQNDNDNTPNARLLTLAGRFTSRILMFSFNVSTNKSISLQMILLCCLDSLTSSNARISFFTAFPTTPRLIITTASAILTMSWACSHRTLLTSNKHYMALLWPKSNIP
ncbi:hypothetical protein Mp_3g15200 [Marchantia polymorpha subsp. ruderalis]|uniref:Uncharacterized protein n=2 Tax=Marchantia polymorpha TaxID=3197 RepID=A0AAF6B108_MARPO|nr:hypothetical protein MARPO_0004s0152 [Marchantia polymorpha]BBN05692.1 hypothetical protein Mp_3g15200 [Marchantia polymorpha subsp. ruderalis]|eukprot:PTQ48890.1 hypothetical protein MARPO_0004s0152 [Marchantia polymorpha]